MTTLPCLGNARLYDIVLFDSTPSADRRQAVHRAAALCATCPSQCGQLVTVDTTPAELVLLEPGWLPPEREGVPEPERRLPMKRRARRPAVRSDYVKPEDRIAAWMRMAARKADEGAPLSAIADDLCITVETAVRLLEMGQAARVA